MSYILDNKIAERSTKTVYESNGNTIKLFIENYSKADILNEALNLARVEEGTDLNIPKLVEVTKIDNRWAIVLEYIDGTPLSKLMEMHPENMDEYMNFFVKVQMEIFSKNVPLLNRIKDKFSRKISNTDMLSDSCKYDLLQRLAGMKSHTKLCHGDFNPSNVIVKSDGSYAIIDWAHVTQGNASADAARTYLLFSIDGKKDLADKYLDTFSNMSGIEKENVQRWIPIVAAVELTKGKKEEEEFLRSWINVVEAQG